MPMVIKEDLPEDVCIVVIAIKEASKPCGVDKV